MSNDTVNDVGAQTMLEIHIQLVGVEAAADGRNVGGQRGNVRILIRIGIGIFGSGRLCKWYGVVVQVEQPC